MKKEAGDGPLKTFYSGGVHCTYAMTDSIVGYYVSSPPIRRTRFESHQRLTLTVSNLKFDILT